MRNFSFLIVLVIIILVVDLYTFRGIRIALKNAQPIYRRIVMVLHWSVPLIFITSAIYLVRIAATPSANIGHFFFVIGFFVLFYVPKLLYLLILLVNDFSKMLAFFTMKISPKHTVAGQVAQTISRSEFLARIGLLLAAIPFLSIIYGMARGRFNFTVTRKSIKFPHLPHSFRGFKILQISDLHLGSFIGNENEMEAAVAKINEQNPDLVLLTGDSVNNLASELEPFVGILSKIKAKYGKFSVFGNHDYGHYNRWMNEQQLSENLESFKKYQREMGFTMLNNDSVVINKGEEQIALVGVENWGLPPFPQYGDYEKASQKVENIPFKILMSHDPSHWDQKIVNKTDVALTLSGHTHGMQFGINIPGIKWSPVQLKYPRWSGLYIENKQYLYVNIGLGFIAFPGRVGMPPEITVIELCGDDLS